MSKDKAKNIIKDLEKPMELNVFSMEIYKQVLPDIHDLDIELPGVKLKELVGTIVAQVVFVLNQKIADTE